MSQHVSLLELDQRLKALSEQFQPIVAILGRHSRILNLFIVLGAAEADFLHECFLLRFAFYHLLLSPVPHSDPTRYFRLRRYLIRVMLLEGA